MYPTARVQSVLFERTGSQALCRLAGREQDINTDITTTSSQAGLSGRGSANTDSLSPGDYTATCTAKSLYWSRDYKYPNTSYTEAISSASATDIQTYTASSSVRVLPRGLIAVMF